MDEIIKLFKEDLLGGIQSLLLIARDSNSAPEKKATIGLGLLIVLSVVLGVVRSLYAPTGITIWQHFLSTFAILISAYLIFGAVMLVKKVELAEINRYAATIFICLLTTGILYFASILLFGFFTGSILDWIDDHVLPPSIRDQSFIIYFEYWVPAMLFSALGCWLVLGNGNLQRRPIARGIVYFVLTTLVFYFAVFDRGGFFDNVTNLLSGIGPKSGHAEIGALPFFLARNELPNSTVSAAQF